MVPPFSVTPSEILHDELNCRVREILKNDYYTMSINKLTLEEDLLEEISRVSFRLNLGSESKEITGTGKGVVDALFTGIMNCLEKEYISLSELSLVDFSIEGDFERKTYKKSNTDVDVEARLLMQSSGGLEFIFRERSPSMNTAAIKVVLKVMEHFINAERAVGVLYECIGDAKKRQRGDLVDNYLRELSELVRSISYEKKIKDLLEAKLECEQRRK